VERLTTIKGIGRWTAEMLLIFNLGRADVLPVHDLGIRKGFQFAYGKRKLPEPEQVARYGVRWTPHRIAAAWYLWRGWGRLVSRRWTVLASATVASEKPAQFNSSSRATR
jgi:DNA-3-methyladenine glycosylase II